MRNYFPIVVLLLTFTACKGKGGPTINDIPTMDTVASEQKFEQEQLDMINRWGQELKGTWYSEEYLNEVKFNLSPYKTFHSKIDIVGMRFDQKMNFSEKKIKVTTFDIHEGRNPAEFYIVDYKLLFNLPTGKNYTVLEVNEKELIAEESTSGKVTTFYKYENLSHALATILMSGKYEIQESGRVINIQPDGTIKDWPSFERFEIPYDFIGLAEFDCVLLSKATKPILSDYTLYRATFTSQLITLTKYNADWTNLNHEVTNEVLHLKKI